MLRFLLLLTLLGCQAGSPLPHKVQPTYTDPLPTEEQPFFCHEHNDCPFGQICNIFTGECSDPVIGDPYLPDSEVYPPSDPFLPSDPTLPPGDSIFIECSAGECTEVDDGTSVCLENGYIPTNAMYCDPFTYEGCPSYLTPYEVIYEDGWWDCICLEECLI